MRIGIDPGLGGAIAFLDNDLKLIGVFDMPLQPMPVKAKKNEVDAEKLTEIFEDVLLREGPSYRKTTQVYLEKVFARRGQGVTSMYSFGEGSGVVRGVIGAFRLPIVRVTPQVWKGRCDLIGKSKEEGRALAQKLYPEASLDKVKDGGRADAILIARFGI
jgi:hypothetical protein